MLQDDIDIVGDKASLCANDAQEFTQSLTETKQQEDTADDGTADDGTADDGTADGTVDDGTADDADDGTADDGTADDADYKQKLQKFSSQDADNVKTLLDNMLNDVLTGKIKRADINKNKKKVDKDIDQLQENILNAQAILEKVKHL